MAFTIYLDLTGYLHSHKSNYNIQSLALPYTAQYPSSIPKPNTSSHKATGLKALVCLQGEFSPWFSEFSGSQSIPQSVHCRLHFYHQSLPLIVPPVPSAEGYHCHLYHIPPSPSPPYLVSSFFPVPSTSHLKTLLFGVPIQFICHTRHNLHSRAWFCLVKTASSSTNF